jgi:lipoprotein-releasing system ATP-binding protein
MRNKIVLSCSKIQKIYKDNNRDIEVLSDISLNVIKGERIAIMGSSGSGKTTLLQVMGGLDTTTSGSIEINGESINKATENQKSDIRNRFLGFIYQFHHLLHEFTAQENVAMPLLIRGKEKESSMIESASILERVGLSKRLDHRPSEMSGGERQRAAVARALITKPSLILADEPTGNLDRGNGNQVMDLMLNIQKEIQSSIVIVTHDLSIAKTADRILELRDGLLINYENQKEP